MATLGSIDSWLACSCQRAAPIVRSKPRLKHPSIRTVRYCTSPGVPQVHADPPQEEQPAKTGPPKEERIVETVVAPDELQASSVPCSEEWELDFSSRPLVDERGKKVWELLICSPDRSFEYSEYFPNNKINSKELARSINKLVSQEGAQRPRLARFFRGQMTTIISRALDEFNIAPLPSRRCFALVDWLNTRLETVYKKDARFSEQSKNLFTLELEAPKELEDVLRGEAWNFVQLPLSTVLTETEDIEKGDIFGASLPLKATGLDDLPMDTLIPGVSVYSRRAEALAAWTNGLEISNIKADIDRAALLLEAGVSERLRYASYARSQENTALALGWEQAKQASRGLHFLAVQEDPNAECCTGLWLLMASKSNV